MGKKQIILYVASSLDGFIARTNGDGYLMTRIMVLVISMKQ